MSAMMLLEWWCGVQQGHSLREEALPEPAGVGAEAPVTPAGWEEGEKPMVRVGGILDDVCHPAQVPNTIPVGRLAVTSDQTYHRGVISELCEMMVLEP